MSELERVTAAFKKADALAQQGNEKAREDAAMFAREIRRLQAQSEPSGPTEFLGQAARSIGGAADFLTAPGQAAGAFIADRMNRDPGHNTPDLQTPRPTGRAATDALVRGVPVPEMFGGGRLGIASPEPPQNVTGAAGKGFGDAMVAFAPVVKALQAARGAGGITGTIADDMYRALATRLGVATETAAGAASGAAQQAVKEGGGSEAWQTAAGMLAPLSVPMAGMAARGFSNAAQRVPTVNYVANMGRDVARMFAPMSETGARQQASRRLEELVGTERMDEMARSINPRDEFGRTPAEQTGDPNLLGLQSAAADADPVLRERLAAGRERSVGAIVDAVRSQGGEIRDTRTFFRKRLSQFKAAMGEQVDTILAQGDEVLEAVGPQRTASENSVRVTDQLNDALQAARQEESALWGAVPQSVTVPTANVKAAATRLIERNSKFQDADVPDVVRRLVGNEVGDRESVGELHGLYSELRRISRVARAGDTQNRNQARIADTLADAILKEFDDLPGQAIAEARAFTRALNEKFMTGAPGKLLARTNQTVSRVTPEAALDATVRGGRAQGGANTAAIRNAAPEAAEDVSDYLRGGFMEAARDASGNFTPRKAAQWMRQNAETLKQFPNLASELQTAVRTRSGVQAYALKLEARAKLAEAGPIARVANATPDKAVIQIIGADNPLTAAKSVANAARKDPSGQALDGLKGAFSDYLTSSPEKMPALLADPKVAGALTRIYSPDEMKRLKTLSRYMSDLNVDPNNVGEVINRPTTMVVEKIVRVLAAGQASRTARNTGMGGTVQIPGMASQTAEAWLRGMTNDKAREILMDAIEDPELMRALLVNAPGPQLPSRVQNKLAPYLTGAVAAEEE